MLLDGRPLTPVFFRASTFAVDLFLALKRFASSYKRFYSSFCLMACLACNLAIRASFDSESFVRSCLSSEARSSPNACLVELVLPRRDEDYLLILLAPLVELGEDLLLSLSSDSSSLSISSSPYRSISSCFLIKSVIPVVMGLVSVSNCLWIDLS